MNATTKTANKSASFPIDETVNIKNNVLASAILHGEIIEYDQLVKVDIYSDKQPKPKQQIDNFIILEALNYAKNRPNKTTTGLTPTDISLSYHDYMLKHGAPQDEADKCADKIEGLQGYRKPTAKQLTKELYKLVVHSDDWLNNWVLIPDGRYFNTVSSAMGKTAWFNNVIAQDNELPLNSSGGEMMASKFSIGKLSSVSGIAYNPKEKRTFKRNALTFANTYIEFTPDGEKCDKSEAEKIITQHLKRLFSDDETQELMLNWMAHQVQNTGELLMYCPLIIGKQGDGKTTISRFLSSALGNRNVSIIGDGEFKSTFTDWANKSAVGVIEEIRLEGDGRYGIYNKIKQFITNLSIGVNPKGLPSINAENVTNYIAYSNHSDAMPVGKHDRRFYAVQSNSFNDPDYEIETPESVQYFINAYDCIDNNGRGIKRFLESHEISESFKLIKTAPMTETKKVMEFETYPQGTKALIERIDRLGSSILIDGMLSLSKLRAQGGMIGDFEYELPDGSHLNNGLKSLGWHKITRVRVAGDKNKSTLYEMRK